MFVKSFRVQIFKSQMLFGQVIQIYSSDGWLIANPPTLKQKTTNNLADFTFLNPLLINGIIPNLVDGLLLIFVVFTRLMI